MMVDSVGVTVQDSTVSSGAWVQRVPSGQERSIHRKLLTESWGLPVAEGRLTPSSGFMAVAE